MLKLKKFYLQIEENRNGSIWKLERRCLRKCRGMVEDRSGVQCIIHFWNIWNWKFFEGRNSKFKALFDEDLIFKIVFKFELTVKNGSSWEIFKSYGVVWLYWVFFIIKNLQILFKTVDFKTWKDFTTQASRIQVFPPPSYTPAHPIQ